jgi:hypothetical protein
VSNASFLTIPLGQGMTTVINLDRVTHIEITNVSATVHFGETRARFSGNGAKALRDAMLGRPEPARRPGD